LFIIVKRWTYYDYLFYHPLFLSFWLLFLHSWFNFQVHGLKQYIKIQARESNLILI
jgi:hypothetical protein